MTVDQRKWKQFAWILFWNYYNCCNDTGQTTSGILAKEDEDRQIQGIPHAYYVKASEHDHLYLIQQAEIPQLFWTTCTQQRNSVKTDFSNTQSISMLRCTMTIWKLRLCSKNWKQTLWHATPLGSSTVLITGEISQFVRWANIQLNPIQNMLVENWCITIYLERGNSSSKNILVAKQQ